MWDVYYLVLWRTWMGNQDVVDNENVDSANLKLRRQFHDRLSLSRVRVFFVAW